MLIPGIKVDRKPFMKVDLGANGLPAGKYGDEYFMKSYSVYSLKHIYSSN